MTKQLSQLLEAKEPYFRQTVQRLERASGNESHDIRLSNSINKSIKEKIKALNLDPEDTADEELYLALQHKLANDDKQLHKKLRYLSANHISAEANLIDGMVYTLEDLTKKDKCFGVKNSVIKRVLIKNPPKKTMKLTGYRSINSMLKHEPLPLIVACSLESESASWIKNYQNSLGLLRSSDCEDKKLTIIDINNEKWSMVSDFIKSKNKLDLIVSKELASIIIMPIESNTPVSGFTTALMSICLNAINEIKSSSSYLKLSQLSGDFGKRLEGSIKNEPELGVGILDNPLSWETVQRFLHRISSDTKSSLQVSIDFPDINAWMPVESMLHKIVPEMSFWKDTAHLSRLGKKGIVSFNILDNAINLCHERQYGSNIKFNAQKSLWQELVLRYIRLDLLEEAITKELQPKLAAEYVRD